MYRNLRAEIARTGMSVQDCADAIGVSVGTVYRLLNGGSAWKLHEMRSMSQAIAERNGHSGLDYLFGVGADDGTE